MSSGVVCASHTNWRGALNVRVTRTSRSLGNVTSAGLGIVFSWVNHRDCALLFFCSFAPGRFGLELFEQRIETLVVLLKDLAITFDPIHGLSQSLRFQFAWTPLRIDVHRDEAGALKHFQMLGDG